MTPTAHVSFVHEDGFLVAQMAVNGQPAPMAERHAVPASDVPTVDHAADLMHELLEVEQFQGHVIVDYRPHFDHVDHFDTGGGTPPIAALIRSAHPSPELVVDDVWADGYFVSPSDGVDGDGVDVDVEVDDIDESRMAHSGTCPAAVGIPPLSASNVTDTQAQRALDGVRTGAGRRRMNRLSPDRM